MVFFDLGSTLEPTKNKELEESYDVIIIGGGPAGMTAGVYAARGGLKTLIIEKASEGGQIVLTEEVENYPGFLKITGGDLAQRFAKQAEHFGCDITMGEVRNVELCCDNKFVILDSGKKIKTNVIIVATGASHKKLGVPGEKELANRGVSYCAICDGAFFRDKHVSVIGGGNSAIEEAIYLSQMASKVTVIHRRDKLRADKIIQDRAFDNPRIEFKWDTVVKEIKGENKVQSLTVQNVKTGVQEEMSVDGVFIYIGLQPQTVLFENLLRLTSDGFIKVNKDTLETSVPGVFAAGDVIEKEIRQIINAAADGAIASSMAIKKYF